MNLYTLFLISLALSLDAFGVSLCIGLNNMIRLKHKLLFAFSFGFFQFLFSIIGAFAGFLFNTYIVSVPKIIGGIVIAVVGILMIKEGFDNKGQCPYLNPKMYLILGVSVSIDAMVIGFTVLNSFSNNIVLLNETLFIGVFTSIVSILGFTLAKYLKKIEIISRYADYIGGIILILFGVKMIFF
jgi:manganese efflux pump family protein